MRIGDIILVRDDEILGQLIDWAESGIYSHVAIYIGDEKIIEAQGLKVVGITSLDTYPFYDVGSVDLSDEEREDLVRYALTQIGTRYDWLLIFLLFLRLKLHINVPYKKRSRTICSTFVRDCFLHSGIKLTDIENCTPQEIANSPELKLNIGRECGGHVGSI